MNNVRGLLKYLGYKYEEHPEAIRLAHLETEVQNLQRHNRSLGAQTLRLEKKNFDLKHRLTDLVKMHSSDVQRLKEEHCEELKSQEMMFRDAMRKMQAESDTVVRGLREESREKTQMLKTALEFSRELQSANTSLTAYLTAKHPEYFERSQAGETRKLSVLYDD